MPIMSSRITLKVFDQDMSGDEIVGSLLFNIKECIETKVRSVHNIIEWQVLLEECVWCSIGLSW